MHFAVTLQTATAPAQVFLEELLDALADHNARWYLAQWRARRDPPIDALAAGVHWLPDRPARAATFDDAPLVFARRWASCGPIAAISVGAARALEQLRGRDPAWARQQHRVVLRPQRSASGQRQWHAFWLEQDRLHDPTRGLKGL